MPDEVKNVEIVEQLPDGEEGDAKLFKEGIDTDIKEEVNNDLYLEATAPLFVDILQLTYNDAVRAGNENLKNAAEHVAKYIFNDNRFATGEVKLPEKKKEEERPSEIEKERQALLQER